MVTPYGAEVERRLASLGFKREGRFWTLPGRDPMLEAPASTLEFNPDGHIEVELASGRTVRVQEVEEVLLVRLAEFVATGNADVFQQCLWLLGVSELDHARLRARAADESLGGGLAALDRIAKTLDQDSTKLEIWEITDLARSLRAPPEKE